MPLIDVTMPAGELEAGVRAALVARLGATLLKWEGAPDTEFVRSIMWVHVHELPADAVNAAGRPVTETHFRLDVTVPQGALSERRKAGAVKELTEAVAEAAGVAPQDALLRIWVLVHEVPDGNWGAGGQIIRFAQLRELVTAQPEPEPEPAPAGD